jgi:hypothetical protein
MAPLRELLSDIEAASVPATSKRRLQAWVVECAFRAVPRKLWRLEDPIPLLEELLAAIARASGHCGRMTVPQAICWLRGTGPQGCMLAKWLGALSKGRIVRAHPDMALRSELLAYTATAGDTSANQSTSTVSTGCSDDDDTGGLNSHVAKQLA